MKETIKRCRASQDSLLNKKETEKKAYAAAVYLRLSKEDGDVCGESCKGESNSITNQKRLIHDFLKDREIRYHEERKTQMQEKIALFERLEKEQAGWIKEILSYKDTASEEEKLTAQMASLFVNKIFLYDGKRVEVVLNFKNEYESLYSCIGQVWGTEEGRS